MDRDRKQAPALWAEELARGSDDVVNGRVVPAHVVHDRLRRAISELQTEIAASNQAETANPPAG
jgi:hypothetical protein